MSRIYLIRHGQAGFGQAEYDVLSELGAVQGRRLGEWTVAAGLGIDRLYTAPRRRHRETAEALRAGVQAAGGSLTEALPAPGFDEFPFIEILRAAVADGLSSEYEALSAELGGRDPLTDARAFGRLFKLSMQRWASGTVVVGETFPEFVARVVAELRRIAAAAGPMQRVAVVTSAGAISAVLMHALGLSPEMMLKLCLSLINTGVSELRVRDGDFAVQSFNATGHLLDPAHRTLR